MSLREESAASSDEEKTIAPLIQKIYEMVSDPATDEKISWTAKGDEILVKNPQEFCEKILPKYFRTRSFSTFVRQLNQYGFSKRALHGAPGSKFRHKSFKKGQKELLCEIKRNKGDTPGSVKKTIARLEKEVSDLKKQSTNWWQVQQSISALRREVCTLRAHCQQTWAVQHQILQALGGRVPENSLIVPKFQPANDPFSVAQGLLNGFDPRLLKAPSSQSSSQTGVPSPPVQVPSPATIHEIHEPEKDSSQRKRIRGSEETEKNEKRSKCARSQKEELEDVRTIQELSQTPSYNEFNLNIVPGQLIPPTDTTGQSPAALFGNSNTDFANDCLGEHVLSP